MAEIAIWFEDSDGLATLKAKGDELLLAGDITGYNIQPNSMRKSWEE